MLYDSIAAVVDDNDDDDATAVDDYDYRVVDVDVAMVADANDTNHRN